MHAFILWCGFAGAWLLVVGPLHQAAVELDQESLSREEINEAAQASVAEESRPSSWWWLVPPVGYWKQRRYAQAQRERMMAHLSPDARLGVVSYMNTARGWFYVAGGASLIAVKETYELADSYEWPLAIFLGLVVVMLLVAAGNTVGQMHRTHEAVAERPKGT